MSVPDSGTVAVSRCSRSGWKGLRNIMARAAASAKDDILAPLIGQRIAVFTLAGSNDLRDEGILEAYESHILRLSTRNGLLFIPIYNVRLIETLTGIPEFDQSSAES